MASLRFVAPGRPALSLLLAALGASRPAFAGRVTDITPLLGLNRTLKLIEVSSQYHGHKSFKNLESCSPPCSQASSVDDADVVYAYSGGTKPRRSRADQVWVGTFWESPEHYPARGHDFDYTHSFRADATFPFFDMIPTQVADLFDQRMERLRKGSELPRRTSFAEKSKSGKQISVWISNCGVDRTRRLDMAADLDAAGVPFASYGRCRHNAEAHKSALMERLNAVEAAAAERLNAEEALITEFLERTHQEPSARDRDMYDTSSKHLFFFAAENSDCAYYHTEKVYHGLLSGSIPVYVGNGDTIDGYVPKGSVIKAADFHTNQELATYLHKVASNETLYNSYFDWYNQDLEKSSAKFREKLLTRRPGGGAQRCNECAFFHAHGRNEAFDAKTVGCSA